MWREDTDLRDVKVEIEGFPGQLLGGVVEYAREGDFWRAARLGAVRSLHVVRDDQTG